MKRKHPAYTKADLRKWRADMTLKRPVAKRETGLVQGVNLVSFDLGASANGAYIRMVNGAGDPPMTVLLNPVVATALRDAIITSGREGGWLEDDGSIVEPILER